MTLKVSRAPPITQDSSSFQGSNVPIATPDDVIPALHAIYADTRVARATHNVYAYRIRPPGSTRTVEHFDDDGEYGAGRRLLELMQTNDITNTLVCVSRWYGGKHLGSIRFDKIVSSAKTILEIS